MGREEKEILAESLGINFIYVREGKLSFYNEKKSQKKKKKKKNNTGRWTSEQDGNHFTYKC